MIHKKYFFLCLSLLIFFPKNSFCQTCHTLEQLKTYADTQEEYPDIDNENWMKPDYTTFYKQSTRSWWQKIWDYITFSTKETFPVDQFEQLLTSAINRRENDGYIGRFVHKVIPKDDEQFIVLGDLHGSFHSLVRVLLFLQKKGIIDNTLKLKDGYSIIFNGNAIDLSPFNLETLLIILGLMEQNPKTVFYTRGKHEDKEHWKNFGLKTELDIRASQISERLIKRFFDTLPLALYLIGKNGKEAETVRISPYGRTYAQLDEENFSDFFILDQEAKQVIRNLQEKITTRKPVTIKAIVKTEERLGKYTTTEGLVQTDSDKGSTAWMVLSAPNRTFRSLYKFFFDAFAIITTKETTDDWTIALYNQDVREQLGIRKTKEFNIVSGDEIVVETKYTKTLKKQISQLKSDLQKCQTDTKTCKTESEKIKKELDDKKKALESVSAKAPSDKEKKVEPKKPEAKPKPIAPTAPPPAKPVEKKVEPEVITDSKDIVVGTTLGLTGNIQEESNSIKTGLELRINKENEAGGINGKKIRLIILDDEYKTEKAKANAEQLVKKHGANIILFPIGSATTQSYIDMVKNKEVVVLFTASGSMGLRSPVPEYFIHLRPSYPDMFYALVTYAKNKLGAKKFAIFSQSDVVAEGLKGTLEKALIDPTDYAEITHKRNITDMSAQAESILKFKPDAIVLWTTSAASMALLKEIGTENLLKTTLMGADMGNPKFNEFLKGMGLFDKYIDAQALPNPETSQWPIMEECREALAGKPIDGLLAEAYICASIFIYLVKQTGGSTDKEKIVTAAKNIKNLDLGGMKLNYENDKLSKFVYLSTADEWTPVDVSKN